MARTRPRRIYWDANCFIDYLQGEPGAERLEGVIELVDKGEVVLVTSAVISGGVMAVYSVLLIILNRRALPEAIKLKGWRLPVLVIAAAFYIFFVSWFILTQIQSLMGG